MHDPIAAAITAESQADIAGDIARAKRDHVRREYRLNHIFMDGNECRECPHNVSNDGGRGLPSFSECTIIEQNCDALMCPAIEREIEEANGGRK